MTNKIMIVDNHFIIREGLKLIFDTNDHYEILYEASNGEQAIQILENARPDLVLLDIKMEKVDGFGVMSYIHDNCPEIPVVVLTTVDSAEHIQKMLKLGAKGYLLKDAKTATIFTTVDSAIRGNIILQNHVSNIVFNSEVQQQSPNFRLTEKETRILTAIAQGLKIKAIALENHVSERTIKSQLTGIYTKMNVATGVQAVALAVKNNMIQID